MTTRKPPTAEKVLKDLEATIQRLDNFDNRLLACLTEMREILEAIAEFWKDYETHPAPLHPGAMITDKEECIAELVRAVVRKAKGGE